MDLMVQAKPSEAPDRGWRLYAEFTTERPAIAGQR